MLAPQELLAIGLVAALLFGAKKLPELGKSLGEGLREFKRSMKSISAEDEEHEVTKPAPDKAE